MTIPSPEEVVERLRMALAEAGYPDVEITLHGTLPNGWPYTKPYGPPGQDRVPAPIEWFAADIAYQGNYACWACARFGDALDCVAGNCQNPAGPSKPPRELLQPRRAS